jgi:predicted nucleic acid-binding protein
MNWFFDTSVLIPTFLEDHEHHEASLDAFLKSDRRSSCCAAHSLAEVYATLTRLPGRHRLSGEQVLLFLENIRERLTLVTLDPEEYSAAVQAAAANGIVGGVIYDALLAQCALKAHAETIYTWNVRHFQRMGPEIARRVKTP